MSCPCAPLSVLPCPPLSVLPCPLPPRLPSLRRTRLSPKPLLGTLAWRFPAPLQDMTFIFHLQMTQLRAKVRSQSHKASWWQSALNPRQPDPRASSPPRLLIGRAGQFSSVLSSLLGGHMPGQFSQRADKPPEEEGSPNLVHPLAQLILGLGSFAPQQLLNYRPSCLVHSLSKANWRNCSDVTSFSVSPGSVGRSVGQGVSPSLHPREVLTGPDS